MDIENRKIKSRYESFVKDGNPTLFVKDINQIKETAKRLPKRLEMLVPKESTILGAEYNDILLEDNSKEPIEIHFDLECDEFYFKLPKNCSNFEFGSESRYNSMAFKYKEKNVKPLLLCSFNYWRPRDD